jgi:hypothetical protein
MPTADARGMPPIAVHWVKNNALAAVISCVASLCIYGARQATGAADGDAGPGGLAIFYLIAASLWAFSGCTDGLFSGAVLQRVVPMLPARTWIGLHAALSIVIGAASEWGLASSGEAPSADNVSMGEMLLSGLISGAVFGAAIGGLEALVLRRAALGSGAWMAWSSVAFAVAMPFFAVGASALGVGGGFAGELANQALLFVTAVIIALVMLQGLRGLKDPMLSRAGEFFS